MIKRAVITVTNDLVTDQRAHKISLTLMEMGYDVTLVGRKIRNSVDADRIYKTTRFKLLFNEGFLFYACYNIRLFFYLIVNRFNLVWSCDLDTLTACYLSSKVIRSRLVYDSHELFTEVPELVGRPIVKKVWLKIEEFIFPKLKTVFTVSNSIANIYSKKYGVRVSVARNLPSLKNFQKTVKTRSELGLPIEKRILLLQGAGINIDRGAEELVEAMKFLSDSYLLLIIGGGDIIDLLKNKVVNENLLKKVFILDKMKPEKLAEYTSIVDLGLSTDKDTNLNYRYSLPNKLFDYIKCEVPVLTSDLIEVKRIIDAYKIGWTFSNHSPKVIAEKVESIFLNEKAYFEAKENTKNAIQELNWENEKNIIINALGE